MSVRELGSTGRAPRHGARLASRKLAEHRERLGLSRLALAQRASITQQYLGRLERENVRATEAVQLALADALGARVDELFPPSEPAEPQILSTHAGARLLGVKDATLWKAADDGRVPAAAEMPPNDAYSLELGVETVGQAGARRLSELASCMSGLTVQTYARQFQLHIEPQLGTRPLATLSEADLVELGTALASEGGDSRLALRAVRTLFARQLALHRLTAARCVDEGRAEAARRIANRGHRLAPSTDNGHLASRIVRELQLRRSGHPDDAIAREVGVSAATVRHDLDRIIAGAASELLAGACDDAELALIEADARWAAGAINLSRAASVLRMSPWRCQKLAEAGFIRSRHVAAQTWELERAAVELLASDREASAQSAISLSEASRKTGVPRDILRVELAPVIRRDGRSSLVARQHVEALVEQLQAQGRICQQCGGLVVTLGRSFHSGCTGTRNAQTGWNLADSSVRAARGSKVRAYHSSELGMRRDAEIAAARRRRTCVECALCGADLEVKRSRAERAGREQRRFLCDVCAPAWRVALGSVRAATVGISPLKWLSTESKRAFRKAVAAAEEAEAVLMPRWRELHASGGKPPQIARNLVLEALYAWVHLSDQQINALMSSEKPEWAVDSVRALERQRHRAKILERRPDAKVQRRLRAERSSR